MPSRNEQSPPKPNGDQVAPVNHKIIQVTKTIRDGKPYYWAWWPYSHFGAGGNSMEEAIGACIVSSDPSMGVHWTLIEHSAGLPPANLDYLGLKDPQIDLSKHPAFDFSSMCRNTSGHSS